MKYKIGIWMLRGVLTALIIFWMMTIFGFSSENGEESQSLSDKITVQVIEIIEPEYNSLEVSQQKIIFDRTSFFVRKTGHYGEYGILGFLVAGLLATFGKIRKLKKKKLTTVLITTTICMLYAATDEFHQGFVDGRSPKVMDVLIDTAGGLTAVIFFVFVWFVIDRKRKKNEFVGE
jgi:hypothetical protein